MPDEREQLEQLQAAVAHRYKIVRELGRGGMATVYLAEEPRHARHLALKVLHPRLAATLGADRFLREIKTIASLSHPHILPLFDSGEADGFLFYVMPYVDGESLRHRLNRERQLSVDDALRITTEVADALGFAHTRGVVHRDVKPENILLEAGHAVVSDFGVAKAITEAGGEVLTDTGLAVGTPQYMSPEQAAGTRDLDGRSDIYSLACVTYEMLAGDPPFAGSIPQVILARKALDSPSPLRYIRETLPSHVEEAVLRALARIPADRFRTMQHYTDALLTSRAPAKAPIGGRAGGRAASEGVGTTLPMELKPLGAELDIFGLTHPGKVQRINQDHFLLCSINREMLVHQTSLPNRSRLPRPGDRRAFVAMVAGGLGRASWGEEASRLAIEVVAQYMIHSIRRYDTEDEEGDRAFMEALRDMASQCHANIAQKGREVLGAHGMTTSLTMWVGRWPRGYLLHIGNSRVYDLRDGKLTRVTEDGSVGSVPWQPTITRLDSAWGGVGLMCTQGLTKHVSDEQICERLKSMTSAKQACQDLLEDALTAGGTHNITILVGRTRPLPEAPTVDAG
jgi:serine/threonine protein phosphatase PrpC